MFDRGFCDTGQSEATVSIVRESTHDLEDAGVGAIGRLVSALQLRHLVLGVDETATKLLASCASEIHSGCVILKLQLITDSTCRRSWRTGKLRIEGFGIDIRHCESV